MMRCRSLISLTERRHDTAMRLNETRPASLVASRIIYLDSRQYIGMCEARDGFLLLIHLNE